MKLRVLGILSALLTLVIAGASFTLMDSASREATRDLQLNRLASLNRFVELAAQAESDGDTDRLVQELRTYSELFDEGAVVRIGDEELVSGGLDPAAPEVAETMRRAAMNLSRTELPRVVPWGGGRELVARPFGNSSQVLGSVVLEVDPSAARADVLERWVAVAAIAVVSGAILMLLAWRVTLWILRPIGRLRTAVQDFAQTETARDIAEEGPPELRQLQRSFSAMSTTVTESLAQQRELIAETSHQLRNPVAALRLRVDTLAMVPAERVPAGLRSVQHELGHLEDLLEAVLRVASAEHRASERLAGRRRDGTAEAPPVLDLREVLAEEVERAGPRAASQSTELRIAASPSGPLSVRCNRFDLEQMIGELLENAMKYAPGASVDVSAARAGSRIRLTVRDHGEGLSDAELVRAGTRFWRSDRHREVAGTGLGLTVVQRLAEANGAVLRLTNADGGGLSAGIDLEGAG